MQAHEGNSERNYQPDRQDGRKCAKGDDSNFEMKIIIQAHLPLLTQRRQSLATGKPENPAALEETAGLIRRSHHCNR
ncbi:hypothetical protein [Bradyrhizobium sp. Arg816]|uniref:hypothetical protein n=1 Tax=Bradyrhizobium sp. Arg816 TaxID=2998491 RepID=UPI00249F38AE|nr:hypothetical protein [Bradyrhizobium sp. Arg816]MDI3562424.1 hypothetical protein [Bradyrhizobium sp. Arg816]